MREHGLLGVFNLLAERDFISVTITVAFTINYHTMLICHKEIRFLFFRGAWSCWQCRQPKSKKEKEKQRGIMKCYFEFPYSKSLVLQNIDINGRTYPVTL